MLPRRDSVMIWPWLSFGDVSFGPISEVPCSKRLSLSYRGNLLSSSVPAQIPTYDKRQISIIDIFRDKRASLALGPEDNSYT